ncbi:uroporphyrinogen-III synthase [Bacillus cihuensis]|uniref:uroporphyrinogen-III synthase n=1 Tax=Bacillus cihuensis TaxID=1208599 RepID=UPI000427D5AD|nr:uroporphyrinogen-III synthase [Bacillus cihuensis]
MNKSAPLKGSHVLITRGKSQAASIVEKVESYGGNACVVPLIDFILPDNIDQLNHYIRHIHEYDWLILTSQNGVDYFFRLLEEQAPVKLPRIAVIGSKTEEYLMSRGLSTDFVPLHFVAEAFVAEFIPMLKQDSRVLIAKGNLARTVIADKIREAGAQCQEMIIYQTVLPKASEPKLAELLTNGRLNIVTFTSSSTVHHFMKIVNKHDLQASLEKIVFACIGPIALKTAESYGLSVAVSPKVYTAEAMIDSLADYMTRQYTN